MLGKSTVTTTGLHLPAGMSAQTVVLPVIRHWTLAGERGKGESQGNVHYLNTVIRQNHINIIRSSMRCLGTIQG